MISVIWVCFRTPFKLLHSSVQSIQRAAKHADVDVELIVVDNGGNDGLSKLLEDSGLSAVRRIGEGINVGFGSAVNEAVANALGDRVLLMNPDSNADVELFVEFNAAEAEWSARRKPVLYGALLINGKLPQVHAYNIWWSSIGLLFSKRRWAAELTETVKKARPATVSRLCGAGLYGDAEALRRLGPFDEAFFLYGEDVDLSLRAKRAGYTLVLVPRAVIVHDAGTSSPGASRTVEQARTDALFRLAAHHRSAAIGLALRLESALVTVAGAAATKPRERRAARLARLREIRRWGLRREAVRYQPESSDSQ